MPLYQQSRLSRELAAHAPFEFLTTMRLLLPSFALSKNSLASGRGHVGYLILTLAVTVAAWLALSAMAAPFVNDRTATGPGVTVRNGSQTNAPLPLRYARVIQATPGARNVAWFAFQIVTCKQAPTVNVTLNAYGGPGAAAAVRKHKVDDASMARWLADPLGLLISDKAAADCAWDVGQGVEPPDVTGTRHLPFHITGTFHSAHDIAFAHFDYINRIAPLFGKDKVFWFQASAGNAQGDELLAARIQAQFVHDFPTVSATTNTTVQNAWARFGKVQQLLAFVMAALLLCAGSVLMSVLAHAAVQRRAIFALLQTFGFRRSTLFGAFVLETLIIVVFGALIGIGVGNLAAHLLASTKLPIFGSGFAIPPWAYLWIPAWLTLLLLAALTWPAAVVRRVRAADYRAR